MLISPLWLISIFLGCVYMKNIKRLLSLCLALLLLLSLSPAAFALDNDTALTENHNALDNNNGDISDNYAEIQNNNCNAYVGYNHSSIINNYGLINTNWATVENNAVDAQGNRGFITANKTDVSSTVQATVINNSADISGNYRGSKVVNNLPGGVIMINNGTVDYNFGTVESNNYLVWYNLGGSVYTGDYGVCCYQYYRISCPSGYNPQQLLTVIGDESISDLHAGQGAPSPLDSGMYYGSFLLFQGLGLSFDVPAGHALEVTGTCTLEEKDGKVTLSDVGSDINIRFIPIPTASSVPATADTSNLPLWSLLLLSFTALALITKKKKA